MVEASDLEDSWMPPSGGFGDMPDWDEKPGKTQITLEGLNIPSGMGLPWDEQVQGSCFMDL